MVLHPNPEFYELYSPAQIAKIAEGIEQDKEILLQYNYFGDGAAVWDEYVEEPDKEGSAVPTNARLLVENLDSIGALMRNGGLRDVVDIGPGNAFPVKNLLGHLAVEKLLGKYVALDISPEMLRIVGENLEQWFAGKVDFELHQLDITADSFEDVLPNDNGRLMVLFGGTLANLVEPDAALRNIARSMGDRDLLLYTKKLDTKQSRQFFSFGDEGKANTLPPIFGVVVDLLNIDQDMYEVRKGFDNKTRQRFEKIQFTKDLTLDLNLETK